MIALQTLSQSYTKANSSPGVICNELCSVKFIAANLTHSWFKDTDIAAALKTTKLS